MIEGGAGGRRGDGRLAGRDRRQVELVGAARHALTDKDKGSRSTGYKLTSRPSTSPDTLNLPPAWLQSKIQVTLHSIESCFC